MERLCCGPNRSLTLKVHQGNYKSGEPLMTMEKPFSLQQCCFLRPNFTVKDGGGNELGKIEDPCRFCLMDQQVKDGSGNTLFTTKGTLFQCGICCPLCFDVNFEAEKENQWKASIRKLRPNCEEICLKTNRFIIDWEKVTDTKERKLLLASAMLLDLEYFEEHKNKD